MTIGCTRDLIKAMMLLVLSCVPFLPSRPSLFFCYHSQPSLSHLSFAFSACSILHHLLTFILVDIMLSVFALLTVLATASAASVSRRDEA
jgi:hypothetical protein